MLFVAFAFPALADPPPISTLTIKGKDGTSHVFSVEVAADAASRETGLMNRKELDEMKGMLFIFPRPRPVMMWMKDTLIPLDMLFIDGRGNVTRIFQNAKPMDESIISSRGVVAYVLELAGGSAAKLGLSEGDKVSGPALGYSASN